MIRKLYKWMMEKAVHPQGERWLAILSFAESSFFPIPTDVMLLPMILAERAKAWRLAAITTVSSVAGAVFGYLIGMFLFEAVAQPILEMYGHSDKMQVFQDYYAEYGVLVVLIGGLTPIPFKVITIASGAAALNPLVFVLSCFAARAPRFFIEAALLWRFGAPIRSFVEKNLPVLFTSGVIVLVGGFVALKFIG